MTTKYHLTPERIHLGYVHALFDDFVRTTRYVELTPDNFPTYSIEFTRLLLDAGSEIDVLAKMACDQAEYQWKHKGNTTITHWREGLVKHYRHFAKRSVGVIPLHFTVHPWEAWDTTPLDKNPDWWNAYNHVKHERTKYFREGNLQNVIYALAGLHSLTMLLFESPGPSSYPSLFV